MFGKPNLLRASLAILLLALFSPTQPAQSKPDDGQSPEAWFAACTDFDDWDKPGPPYRIFGNTYYVGTCGISAFLITGPEGHTLIDTGTRKGAEIVARNIQMLGFDLTDVKVILISHEHFDHVGGLSWMKKKTGARVVASSEAWRTLRTGVSTPDDPQYGTLDPMEPVEVENEILDNYGLSGGTYILEAIPTPGHTPGATSWTWASCQDAICLRFVLADSLSAISAEGYRFSDHPAYVAAFRAGLQELAGRDCDVLLTPHPSSSDMRSRIRGPRGLYSPGSCRAYANKQTKALDERLAKEAAGK